VTRGIPLAVSLICDLLKAGQDAEAALRPVPQPGMPSAVTCALAERYLVHALTCAPLQADVPLLYGQQPPRVGGQPLYRPFPQHLARPPGQDRLQSDGQGGQAGVDPGRGIRGDPPHQVVLAGPVAGPAGSQGGLADPAQPVHRPPRRWGRR
jgi:hypothetical protein